MTEGERVKYLRKEVLGLTLKEFGDKIGAKVGTLSALETGKSGLSNLMQHSICSAYGVTEEWLLTGNGPIFKELDQKTKLMKWAEEFIPDEPDNFRSRFVDLLVALSPEWWDELAKKTVEIYERYERQDSADALQREVDDYRRELEIEAANEKSQASDITGETGTA